MKDISLYFWWLDLVLDSTYIIRSNSIGKYITKNSVLLKHSQCQVAMYWQIFLWTRNQTVPEDYIYTTYVWIPLLLQLWILIGKTGKLLKFSSDNGVGLQDRILVAASSLRDIRATWVISWISIHVIHLIFATFLKGGSVVTYFWDILLRGAKTAWTLWTWKNSGFKIVPNNLDDQILLEQVKNIIITSLILIGFWKSNLLGASSATLLLNTLRVLVISFY